MRLPFMVGQEIPPARKVPWWTTIKSLQQWDSASPWPEGSHEQESGTVFKYPLYQRSHRKGPTEGHLAKDESMRPGLEDVSAKENQSGGAVGRCLFSIWVEVPLSRWRFLIGKGVCHAILHFDKYILPEGWPGRGLPMWGVFLLHPAAMQTYSCPGHLYDTLPMFCRTIQGNTSPLGVAGNAWEQAKLLATPAHWCVIRVFHRPPPMGCSVAPSWVVVTIYLQDETEARGTPRGMQTLSFHRAKVRRHCCETLSNLCRLASKWKLFSHICRVYSGSKPRRATAETAVSFPKRKSNVTYSKSTT